MQNYHQLKNKIGVYLLYTENELSYVGRSSNLQKRLNQHFNIKDPFYQEWKSGITKIEYYLCSLIGNTDIIETYLINTLNPVFNIDKVYIGGIDLFIELPEKYEIKKEEREKPDNCSYSFCTICKSVVDGDISLESIKDNYPLIIEAFEKLGAKKMKALKYRESWIRDELVVKGQLHDSVKITKLLDLKVGDIIVRDFLKQKIQTIYDQLGINKRSKATDINSWYTVKIFNKRMGESVVAHIQITGLIYST